jgi:hypothetical protein
MEPNPSRIELCIYSTFSYILCTKLNKISVIRNYCVLVTLVIIWKLQIDFSRSQHVSHWLSNLGTILVYKYHTCSITCIYTWIAVLFNLPCELEMSPFFSSGVEEGKYTLITGLSDRMSLNVRQRPFSDFFRESLIILCRYWMRGKALML